MSKHRIVLACPEGLDTSVAIGGIAEGTGAEVVADVLGALAPDLAVQRDPRVGDQRMAA